MRRFEPVGALGGLLLLFALFLLVGDVPAWRVLAAIDATSP